MPKTSPIDALAELLSDSPFNKEAQLKERFKNQNPELLRCRLERYLEKHDFRPGQLVRWKPYMRNVRIPTDDEVCIVVEVVKDAPTLTREASTGTPYFAEKSDIVIGLIDEDGQFTLFALNSSRLEPVTEVEI